MSGTVNVDPHFTHDCDKCVFLGRITRSETILVTDEVVSALTRHIENPSLADLHRELRTKPSEFFDLYFCTKQGENLPTVIARYGDDPDEYKSGIRFGDGSTEPVDEELALAVKLARKMGLLPICGVTDKDDEEWDG